MFSTLLTVALFAPLALKGVNAEFACSTPELTQCQEGKITWEPTTGPYHVYVVDPADPCGEEIAHLTDTDNTWYPFQVPFPAGMNVQFYIEDSTGDEAWSGSITVGESSDSSCILPELAGGEGAGGSAPTPTQATTARSSPSQSVAPVGAANAGNNPLSGAASPARKVNTLLMAFGVFAAFIVLPM